MRKYISILILLASAAVHTACNESTVTMDDSVDVRVDSAMKGYQAQLAGAEFGWFADIETSKGFYRFWMEIDDLAKGLPDDLFDFILFDACYMASVECTYELRNKAEYILASPTETMADGWPYEEMMPQLFATDLQLEKVGETFYNHYLNNTYPYATVSLTKTSELDNLKSVTHDILADKTESDIYSLDPKKMQRLEYLYRSPGMLYDFNDYIKQLATAEQYDRFISCLDKAVVYKAHTPKSYYAAIGNALPIKSYCGLTIFVPQESLPKMLEWYKQRVGWYKAVYE